MAKTDIEKSILATIENLQQLKDINSILDTVLLEARKLAKADAGTIFLATHSGLTFNYVQMSNMSVKTDVIASHYRYYTIPIDKSSIVGYCAATGEEVAIDDAYNLPPGVPFSFNSYFDRKTGYRTRSVFALPLKTLGNKLVGVLELINAIDGHKIPIPFSNDIRNYVSRFAGYASAAIERGQWNQELILRMIRMAELRDPGETAAHVQRVSAISAEIYTRWAKKKNLDPVEIQRFSDLLRPAAMLHDVGKIGIPDEILKKPGKLSNDEFELIKLHTIYGANLFETTTSDLDQICKEIALNHHEQWDGEGYPGHFSGCVVLFDKNKKPKKGEEIPLAARIVALADVFDALANKRVYKKAWGREEIYNFIREEAGGHFDPELVEAFFEITDVVEAIQNRYKDISQSGGIKSPSAGALKNPNIVREQQLACGCPDDIYKEMKFIISLMLDDFDFDFLDLCFENTAKIFSGHFPGYQACNTSYHNLDHTMAVTLALMRLMHGVFIQNRTKFTPEILECGVISAFFHDAGLIQKTTDRHGTGAKYIQFHEERSILFVHEYLKSVGRPDRMGNICAQMIQCTKLSNAPSKLHFDSGEIKLMGYILGTADIIAQMADRVYLERLPLLFDELKEGGAEYDSTVDIYHQTVTFYKEVIRKRLYVEFDGIIESMRYHFLDRWNIDQNLYVIAIENNINYIEYLNKTCPQDKNFYRQYLRRQINY